MSYVYTPKLFGSTPPFAAITALAALFSVSPVHAQGYNPAGSTVTVNGGNYNIGYPFNGYNNYGNLTVKSVGASSPQFNGNFLGLYNGSGTATVKGGTFDNNYVGFDSEHGTIVVTGGAFDSNTYGVFNNLASTALVSGGLMHGNGIGLLNWSSTAYVTGGVYNGNNTNIQDISGTMYLSGGTFTHTGSNYDLFESAGTMNVYGTAFSVPVGSRPQGIGSFTWTQSNGSVQTVSYDNADGGTINLILGAPPTPVPEMSSSASMGILSVLTSLIVLVSRRRSSQKKVLES